MINNLKKVLKEKKISYDAFSKMADVTTMTVRNWCNSDNLSPKKQNKISELLDLKIKDIFINE